MSIQTIIMSSVDASISIAVDYTNWEKMQINFANESHGLNCINFNTDAVWQVTGLVS